MLIIKSRKRESAEGIEFPNQKCIRTFGEMDNHKYLGILEVDPIKQVQMKETIRVSQKNKKASPNQALQLKSHQRDKQLHCPPCKILGTILKMDKGGTQFDGPKDKKMDNYA